MASASTIAQARRPLAPLPKARLAGEILVTYARVRRALRRSDLRSALSSLRAVGPVREPVSDTVLAQMVGARLGRAVLRTLRPLPTDTRCLTRALVLTAVLARRGIDSTVVIGVTSTEGFRAHAWVEKEGLPLLDEGEVYERLVEL